MAMEHGCVRGVERLYHTSPIALKGSHNHANVLQRLAIAFELLGGM